MEEKKIDPDNTLLDQVLVKLKEGDPDALREQLEGIHAADVANVIESMPPVKRIEVWEAVEPVHEGEVLANLHEKARSSILNNMDTAEVVAAAEQMDTSDLAEVLESLSIDLTEQVLQTLDSDYRQRLETTLSYAEGSAGRIMSRDVVSVRKDVSLAVVQRYLRFYKDLPLHTDAISVIDEHGEYLGSLMLSHVLTQTPELKVEDIMIPGDWISDDASEHDVVIMFERRDLISVAVLDDNRHLLGRITVDDIMHIVREESDRAYLQRAGLNEEEDLFAPILPSAKRRAVWLGINLATVFLAAWVIGQFEAVLDKLVALAVLLPIVASMGGIAGSQTLTLTIRGQALGQIAAGNIRWLFNKELAVGLLNGLAWAVTVAIVTQLWFKNWGISGVIATAMIINLFAAAASGVAIPVVLKRLGIDPALSGAVILTTVTDIVGFMSFLGLATLLLL